MTLDYAIDFVEQHMLLYPRRLSLRPIDVAVLELLVQTAKDYKALVANGKDYTYDDIMNVAMREK